MCQEGSSATVAEDETGRFKQRRRTRTAIVDAAASLLLAGATPSINEIAQAAEMSRRTVYQYFPTLEQLLLDATAGLLAQARVEAAIDAAGEGPGDAVQRVAAMVAALGEVSARTLPLGRSLIRLTVAAPDAGQVPRRGYRRVGWIEKALEPVRPDLDETTYQRLVSALTVVVGWEALIVLQDVRGLSPEASAEVTTWVAGMIIDAALGG